MDALLVEALLRGQVHRVCRTHQGEHQLMACAVQREWGGVGLSAVLLRVHTSGLRRLPLCW